jgi:hypothetical protein
VPNLVAVPGDEPFGVARIGERKAVRSGHARSSVALTNLAYNTAVPSAWEPTWVSHVPPGPSTPRRTRDATDEAAPRVVYVPTIAQRLGRSVTAASFSDKRALLLGGSPSIQSTVMLVSFRLRWKVSDGIDRYFIFVTRSSARA